jgi:hypothetical protein
MSSHRPDSPFSESQLAAAAELAKQAAALAPALLARLEQAVSQKSPEFESFERNLMESNRRGARRTSGRIV